MKNEEVFLDIIDYGSNFEGIAKVNGKVVFINDVLKDEKIYGKIIKENKDYMIAKKINIIEPSKYRVEPFCEVYDTCGGCSAQHILYSEQLKIKKKNIENLLKKYNVEYGKLEDVIGQGMPYYYRNKVQYPVSVDKDGKNIIGFYSKHSNNIVKNSCCYIEDRVIDMVAKAVFNILDSNGFKGYNKESFFGDIRHILVRRGYHTSEIMVVIVVNNEEIFNVDSFKDIISKILSLNSNIKAIFLNLNTSKNNEIIGDKILKLYGEDYIKDIIGKYKYYISPKSFFQTNTIQAEVLYEILKEKLNLNKNEIVFDLYSGVGSIGIFLSDEVKEVYGIEIEEEAVKMANLNLKINEVTNAYYVSRRCKG